MDGFSKFIKSFYYASQGIKTGWQQRNFKVHVLASVLVFFLGLFLQISQTEWIIIFILLAMMFSAELFNTAIEEVCNLLKLKLKLDYYDTWHPRNLAAAAVFVVALTAAVIGLLIFVPKIIGL